MNLITNAFHAVEKGRGTIRVPLAEARFEKEDPELRTLEPGRYVVLSVSDTGSGIDPEVMPKIFVPYFTTKEMGTETGLGLAVVYGFVKEHHGDVFVFSGLGEGTTFRIFPPRRHSALFML